MGPIRDFNGCMAFIVVKAPEPGKVKSRLSATIGNEKAADMYISFVRNEIETLRHGDMPLTVLYHPLGSETAVRNMVGEGLVLKPQRGKDLGERLMNGFMDLFEGGYDRVIALSSDVPELTSTIVCDAFNSLKDHDAVLGPCTDGGYYLIGFRTLTFRPEALTEVTMGTESTASNTLDQLRGSNVKLLPVLSDIDTIEDLKGFHLRRREKNGRNDDL